MSESHHASPLADLARVCARRPWTVVITTLVALALAGASLSRLKVSASLEAMLGSHSASAVAFHRVMTEFQAGEALLVIVEPRGVDRSAPAKAQEQANTVAFADALVEALHADPRTRDRLAWVRDRQDPAFVTFAAQKIFPSGPYYLGESGTREFLARFEPAALADQFARNESLLASPGPAGEALGRTVLKDPLRLFELATAAGLGGFDASAPGDPTGPPPPEFSKDGHAVLVRIAAKASLNDLEEARSLVKDVTAIAEELNQRTSPGTGGVTSIQRFDVRLGGAYAISAISSGTIRFDSIVSTLASIGLIYACFAVFYRRWLTPVIVGLVAGTGMIVGFGVHALWGATVSPLAAAVAAMLVGLGVDYSIHFIAHFDELRGRHLSAWECAVGAAQHTALPITTNCFTSIFGFASLWPSPIEMLSDFARLGTAGLVGAWLAAFTILPALLVLTHRKKHDSRGRPPRFVSITDTVAKRPTLWASTILSLLLVVFVAACSRGLVPQLEGDLTVLHPRPNAALATTDEILNRFAGQGEMIPVLVRVESAADLLPTTIDAAKALLGEPGRSVGVADVLGLHRLLPDPRSVDRVRSMLEGVNPDQLLARFDEALANSAFDPAAYSGYRTFLKTLLDARRPPTLHDLDAFPSITQRLFPTSAPSAEQSRQTILIVRLDHPLRDRAQRGLVVSTLRRELEPIKGATLAGLAAVSTELEDTTKQGLPRSVALSSTMVLCWLILVFRRPLDVLLALIPLVFAATFTVSLMVAIGEHFNPINSIAIPLMDGIAVDAGVFLVSVARQARREGVGREVLVQRLRPTMPAVLLASVTTVVGFASLLFTHTPAVRSLGLVAGLGIAASFLSATGVLVPCLLKRAGSTRS